MERAMGVLLAGLVLVAVAGGGGHAAVTVKGPVAPRFLSASEVMAYWQTVLPNTPVPSAILDHCNKEPAATGVGKAQAEETKLCCTNFEGYKECVEGCWDYYPKEKAAKICSPGCQEAYRCVTVSGDEECPSEHTVRGAENDDNKPLLTWRAQNKGDDHLPFISWRAHNKEGRYHVHMGGHNDGDSNLFFSEDLLIPETTVTQRIQPATSAWRVPFLRRDVADSIPISMKNFTHIMAMFAPPSLDMAGGIRFTLAACDCEHPHPVKGKKQACATSVESMVELATSVLGTPDLRAFSSPEVPAAGVPGGRYRVAAVRAVTTPGRDSTTMTCHGTAFPYAVFYCHAVNPTRVYDVTLQSTEEEKDLPPPTTMRALAVCHTDTSEFDPDLAFFVERGLKPGDAPLCHFLGRDSILWASASAVSRGQVAAQ